MADTTNIEWADATLNYWIGCTQIAPACDNCYALTWGKRFGVKWGNHPRHRTAETTRKKLHKYQRNAAKFFAEHGRRQRIFINSLSDFFDNQVPEEWRAEAWEDFRQCPDLDILLLTKRPQNIIKMLPDFWDEIKDNIWCGTTAENQEAVETNIPYLIKIDCAVRFVSYEPALGPVNFTRIKVEEGYLDALQNYMAVDVGGGYFDNFPTFSNGVDWVIAGGESGPNARPAHPDWFRSVRDQCELAEIPHLFKQWGEHLPWELEIAPFWESQNGQHEDSHTLFPGDMDSDPNWDDGLWAVNDGEAHAAFQRIGKKNTGRKLDGVTHDGFPIAERAR